MLDVAVATGKRLEGERGLDEKLVLRSLIFVQVKQNRFLIFVAEAVEDTTPV